MAPIPLRAVFLKILAIVAVVNLLGVLRVLPLLEVGRHMLYLVLLLVAADCSLLLFQASLLISRKFEVAILEGSLVRTETTVGRGKLGLQLARQIIELDVKMTHAVHVLPVLRVGTLFPGQFNGTGFDVSEGDGVTPSALDLIGDLPRSRVDIANDSMIGGFGPSALEIFKFSILFFRLGTV